VTEIIIKLAVPTKAEKKWGEYLLEFWVKKNDPTNLYINKKYNSG